MKYFFLGIGATQAFDGQGSADFIKSVMEQYAIEKFTAIASLKKIHVPNFLYDLETLLNAPLYLFKAEELEKQTPLLKNASPHVFKAVGCHSVCEAAALKCAESFMGKNAELIIEKTTYSKMSIAVSRVMKL